LGEVRDCGVIGVQFSGLCDQNLSEIGEDAPISALIGIGQGGAADIATNAEMVKFFRNGLQWTFAHFDHS
jgi:hypothetical protein